MIFVSVYYKKRALLSIKLVFLKLDIIGVKLILYIKIQRVKYNLQKHMVKFNKIEKHKEYICN